jgi:hypothetical protein
MTSEQDISNLSQTLQNLQDQVDHVGVLAQDTMTLTDAKNGSVYSVSGLNYSNTVIGGGAVGSNIYPYTYTAGTGTGFANPWATNTTTTLKGQQLELEGPGADVVVNGRSLITTLEAIERRLNLLNVNPELEAEWAELKDLGDQYRALEQHIQAKQATWDKLKAMPPPTVD